MHEMSAAENIYQQMKYLLQSNNHITRFIIEIGDFSFISAENFTFWLKELLKEHQWKIPYEVKTVEGEAQCQNCHKKFSSKQLLSAQPNIDPHHPVLICPHCHHTNLKILTGDEVLLKTEN